MPIDASIYGMMQPPKAGPGPLELAGQGLQIGNLIGQRDLQGMQIQQAQQQQQEGQQVRDLFRNGTPTSQQVSAINPKLGMEMRSAELKDRETQGGIDKNRAETLLKNSTLLRDQLAQVRDQASYDAWREFGAKLMGPDMAAKVPAQFTPELQAQMLRKADDFNMSMAERLRLDEQKRHAGVTEGQAATTAAEAARHNKAMEGQQTGGNVASLRKEFNDLPEVKNFRSVVPIINSAVKAPDTRAGDIQFAYTIGKIFDPNSVVREGELKLVGEAATIFEKYMGELRTLTEGKGRLTPQTRKELLDSAMSRVNELDAAQKAARSTYERTAASRGLPTAEIFIDMPKIEVPKKNDPRFGGAPSQAAQVTAAPAGSMTFQPQAAGGIKFLGFEQ